MVNRRFSVLLLGALALVATKMALLGIYGVLACAVAQRTHEIGIRMAFGASRLSVVKGVMRQGMVMAVRSDGDGAPGGVVAAGTFKARSEQNANAQRATAKNASSPLRHTPPKHACSRMSVQ